MSDTADTRTEVMDAEREEGMKEAEPEFEAIMKGKRHPGDFYDHPSNEQMEYFKRGGR